MNPNDVSSKDELVAFLHTLRHDLTDNASRWENQTLESFLEAMAAWLNDSDDANAKTPTWSLLATSLLAGKAYE
ncbi:hypothetical protein M5X11_30525 [Paenibacillus alginolyticus]|uniref:DUF7660 family protein n=1 Tax=Paenibacillus alginolyticus TaxID=59839 RepID=UPI00041BB941|nr:hypothetical protein [Paenibacillus alginolyticus]MCY9669210.1 hypothetical protein [Paenibacillus alginolyticus]